MATPTRRLRLYSRDEILTLPGLASKQTYRRLAKSIPPWCGRCTGPHWGRNPLARERYLTDDAGNIDIDRPCAACNPDVVGRRS